MYIVRFLHHPDTHGLAKKTKRLRHPGIKHGWFPTQVNEAETFTEVFFEYYGNPEYDVTPYNQRTCVVIPFPPKRIKSNDAIELCNDVPSTGDELTYCIFDENKKRKACLRIYVDFFTLDKFDPRKKNNWNEIVKRIKGIKLEFYDDDGKNITPSYVSSSTFMGLDAEKFSDVFQDYLKEGGKSFGIKLYEAKVINKLIKTLCDDFCLYAINELAKEQREKYDTTWDYIYDVKFDIESLFKKNKKGEKNIKDIERLLSRTEYFKEPDFVLE